MVGWLWYKVFDVSCVLHTHCSPCLSTCRVEKVVCDLNKHQSPYFDGFSDKMKDLSMITCQPAK